MKNIVWMLNRLKAMNAREVAWRIDQKALQLREKKRYEKNRTAVTDHVFNRRLASLTLRPERLCLNQENKVFGTRTSIPLPGGYDYETYQSQWHAGFQTQRQWPLCFAYDLQYKQRDDIGDARTNWELNRHFQFAMLAKNYAATGDARYLRSLEALLDDWDASNPFLFGISWTSVMEAAIRASNWTYAYGFLSLAKRRPEPLMRKLQTGIVNMTEYVSKHYSRYSSANNHLIVEAYAIGQSGILLGYQPWIDLAVGILTEELPRQNYPDGVNKELSLHYQAFYMEAMGLMMRLLIKNNRAVPPSWPVMLHKMCKYVRDCMGDYGEVVEFGDNDGGKILDLQGDAEYYTYVLGLLGCMLEKRYVSMEDSEICETLRWLFTDDELRGARQKPRYVPGGSVCYREGGNTILRGRDGRVLIGIDHAALGFGSVAAHAHADALSFQMFVEGEPVFADPGTYLYHCDMESRNAMRKTESHSTVCVGGKDQSEMLGAFLWGKRANCRMLTYQDRDGEVCLKAEHDGYALIVHTRTFTFDGSSVLKITDEVRPNSDSAVYFMLAPGTRAEIANHTVSLRRGPIRVRMTVKSLRDGAISMVRRGYSAAYGHTEYTAALCITPGRMPVETLITIEDTHKQQGGETQ